MRRLLFWAHLAVGVAASVLILFFSVTGALLAYERPLLQVADQHATGEQQSGELPGAARLPLERLLAKAATTIPGPVDSVVVKAAPDTVELQTARHQLYRIDPFTGRAVGPLSPRLRGFFTQVTALHRWFGSALADHASAVLVKGGGTLALLFSLLTGVYLWLPRAWTRRSVASGLVPDLRLRGRARNYNWHKVTGMWIGLPLGVVALTGVIMAFAWANALLFRLAGSPLPKREVQMSRRQPSPEEAKTARAKPQPTSQSAAPSTHGPLPERLEDAFHQATNTTPGWRSASLRLHQDGKALVFVIDTSEGGHPEARSEVTLDADTLDVKRVTRFRGLSRGQQWRSWVRFVHTGEAGGLCGETLALLTGAGAVLLAISGLLLSLNRLQRWRAQP